MCKKQRLVTATHTVAKRINATMPGVSYSKWDHIDDSDDDEPVSAANARPGKDPAMDAFFNLPKDASIAEIQQTISKMPAATREELLRHEKGGLLKRMMELDPNKTYEQGEIFGTAPRASGAPAPAPAKAKAPAPARATHPASSTLASAASPASSPTPSAKPPSTRASTDYRKFDNIPDLADIDDDDGAAVASSSKPSAAATAAAAATKPREATASAAVVPAPAPAPAPLPELAPGHEPFTFVRLPADCNAPIELQTGFTLGGQEDALPTLLAPLFRQQPGAKLDAEMVTAHVAARYQEMKGVRRGNQIEPLPDAANGDSANGDADPAAAAAGAEAAGVPSVNNASLAELDQQTKGGVCEAWPLAPATEANGNTAVKLYIDEVGALRKRPRNPRAEALALATGQPGLSIHGDAYVGRVRVTSKWGDEANVDFGVPEMAHDAPWVAAARAAREAKREASPSEAAAAKSSAAPPGEYAFGADAEGRYTWSQTAEDVEVRVRRGVPTGAAAKRRVKVGYAGGASLHVAVDGATVLHLAKLYDRVKPDESSWLLDGEELVVTMEKMVPNAWVALTLEGDAPPAAK